MVTRVIDGDTIIIEGGYRVRYIGIDTPEIHPEVEAFGIQAWQANRRLVEGKQVRLERDVSETDKYGRLLRYVYVDDILVNAELVRQGLAQVKAYPPDTKYQDYLEEMEAEARNEEEVVGKRAHNLFSLYTSQPNLSWLVQDSIGYLNGKANLHLPRGDWRLWWRCSRHRHCFF